MKRFAGINNVIGLMLGMLLWTAPPVWAAAVCNANIRATTPTSDFTLDDANGMATHLKTGLTWMRCALDQRWNSAGKTCTGSPATYTWGEALRAAQGYSFAGYSDWRLPNIKELATIVERRCYSPSFNETIFPEVMSSGGIYWSSSPVAGDPAGAWVVDFGYGLDGEAQNSGRLYARLVRGGQQFGDYVKASQTPWVEPPAPEQRYDGGTGCETPQTGRNAVVITHGWGSDATDWVNDMATAICSQIGGTAVGPPPNQPKKLDSFGIAGHEFCLKTECCRS